MIAIDWFAPIALGDLQASAELRVRRDCKYVLQLEVLEALLAQLADTHQVLEIDRRRLFDYRTTYYDTADLLCLREHTQGRRRRFKLRKRRYLDTAKAFVEVKLTGFRGTTVKEVLPSGFDDELEPDELEFLSGRVHAAFGRRLPADQLASRLDVGCRRLTLAAPQLGERVTCDVALELGGHRLRAGLAIVESKSASGNTVADRALRRSGQRPVAACSKYLLGRSFAEPALRVNAMRPLHRHFEPV